MTKKSISHHLSEERLLLVGSYPPPFGGISSFIIELEKGLATNVSQFYVLHFADTSCVDYKQNITVHKLQNRPNRLLINVLSLGVGKLFEVFILLVINVFKDIRLYSSAILQALYISMIAKKENSTSITIFSTAAGAVIPYLSRLIPNIPIYYCVFADPYKNPKFYRKHKMWYRDAMLGSRQVFSSSYYCASVTKFFDISINPKVIYVGIDIDRFHPKIPEFESRQKLNLPIDKQIVLSVSRMELEMGVLDTLKIAEQVLINSTDIIFVIAGAYGSVTPLVEAAAQASGGRIICRVNLPGDDLPLYYAASTIVIAPTVGVHACMGVSVKEAMSSGRPVIVSNSGGLPEAVVHQSNGIIVPLLKNGDLDIFQFSNSILTLIYDSQKLTSMGKQSRLRAEAIFSSTASITAFSNLLTSTVSVTKEL